jgi:hypothetical protein
MFRLVQFTVLSVVFMFLASGCTRWSEEIEDVGRANVKFYRDGISAHERRLEIIERCLEVLPQSVPKDPVCLTNEHLVALNLIRKLHATEAIPRLVQLMGARPLINPGSRWNTAYPALPHWAVSRIWLFQRSSDN